jgi:hypothetical protein
MKPAILTKKDLEEALDRFALRMTVRFGVMLGASLAMLAVVLNFAKADAS